MEQRLWTCEPPCPAVFDRSAAFDAHVRAAHADLILAAPVACVDCHQPGGLIRGRDGVRCAACHNHVRQHLQGM